MHIGISNLCYEHKPTQEEIEKMKFSNKEVNIDDFSSLIKEGYAYTSVMKDDHRSKDNFIKTNIITFDIDSCSVNMDETLKRLSIKPYICYTSPSNGLEGKGYRYRMIYCLEEPITKREDYYVYARSLEDQLALQSIVGDCVDNRSYYPEQYWNGCRGCNIFLNHSNNNILSYNDILLNNNYRKDYHSRTSSSNSTKVSVKHNKEQQNILCVSDTFMDDYWNMTYQDFLTKYIDVYSNIMATPIEYNEDDPIVYYPENYYEIRRPWYKVNGETYKLKDGHQRRKTLYTNGIIRRLINPDITFDNLLYNLVFEFQYYYINNGNKIDKKILYGIAMNAMEAEIDESLIRKGRPRYNFFINPLYCKKHGMKAKQVLGQVNNKKQYIGEFYDLNLTDQENIEIMKEYGLVISKPTLDRWKKENGIKKYKKSS